MVNPVESRSGAAVLRTAALAVGIAAGAYAACVALAWTHYGRGRGAAGPEREELLDRFMPMYEVRERHRVRVSAPAAITLAAARDMALFDAPPVRAIIRARELVLGAAPSDRTPGRGLLEEALARGWGLLAETPDREIVLGAITRPWEPDVTFHALEPAEFAAFHEPGWVKIAWTLRAEPEGPSASIFTTETRVATTDGRSRARFRRYWALVSPGIVLIRLLALPLVKREAEHRARTTQPASL